MSGRNTPAGAPPARRPTAGRVGLTVAGLVAIVIGGALLTVPATFHAGNGIEYAGNSSLLSETRGAGGALLATGVLVMLGGYVRRLTYPAALVGAVVYLAYGLSRLLGMMLDGPPAAGLVAATVVELILGVVCGRLVLRYDRQPVTPLLSDGA
ncbi:DUF4345 domain-containing protein [Micromonospora sp. C51]|uniref:DUF4345 domain-containing protein n=1 Tax=Micromonospora sp. C51 TaxID=2824879 RepID=UPI001B358A9B|nr:DUF4345 domain-containing protein [Micromonospora sp. C51]MBQ1050889.1 DUF4345 domain-containing protein [Micromonospora sp. C51]